MVAARLDHINVQTIRLGETVRFYAGVPDLEPRDPPPPLDPARVQWMHGADGEAIFHLSTPGSLGTGANIAADTGAVHHVALHCEDHRAMIARLTALCLDHRVNHVAAIGLTQIFVHDPNGVLLELNFRDR